MERDTVDLDARITVGSHTVGVKRFDQAADHLLGLPCQVPQSQEGLLDPRVVFMLQQREQLMANAVACLARGRIRPVFAKRLLKVAQV